jgi:hypothetical protein
MGGCLVRLLGIGSGRMGVRYDGAIIAGGQLLSARDRYHDEVKCALLIEDIQACLIFAV